MPDPVTAPPFRRSIAAVIGIDSYAHGVPPLRTAVNDARRLGELLATHHGYEVLSLLDAEATRARIVTLLKEELPARVEPDDRVFIYFAGHGVAVDGHDGPNGYLLPVDASRADESTFLAMPLLHEAIVALPCRHMLVVFDSCFSGAFRWSGTRSASALPAVIHRERYERFVRDPAWQVITSASQDEEALDRLRTGSLGGRDSDGAHSPFALALFEALEGQGDIVPKGGGDGLITATELYLYIEDRLQSALIEAGAAPDAAAVAAGPAREGRVRVPRPGQGSVAAAGAAAHRRRQPVARSGRLRQGRRGAVLRPRRASRGPAGGHRTEAVRGRARRLGHRQVEPGEGRRAAAARDRLTLAGPADRAAGHGAARKLEPGGRNARFGRRRHAGGDRRGGCGVVRGPLWPPAAAGRGSMRGAGHHGARGHRRATP